MKTTHHDINRALELARRGTGVSVTYYPTRRSDGRLDGEPLHTVTRSQPWALGDGSIVVAIDGKSGGVAIEHLRLWDEKR